MNVTIYHNPRCGKSRGALEILQERQLPLRVIEYLKTPPTRAELATIRELLGVPAAQWVRRQEAEYGAAGLSAESSDKEILDAMAKYPALIERPIVIVGQRAVVARPSERVLELLD
jgi:arsenate reductase (glutaredoxin)